MFSDGDVCGVHAAFAHLAENFFRPVGVLKAINTIPGCCVAHDNSGVKDLRRATTKSIRIGEWRGRLLAPMTDRECHPASPNVSIKRPDSISAMLELWLNPSTEWFN